MAGVGESWENLGYLDLPDGQVTIWSMLDLGRGKILAGTYTGFPSAMNQVYRSVDYGASWTALGRPAASESGIYCFAYLGWGIVVGGTERNGKIIRSIGYGQTWTDLGNQSPGEVRIKSLVSLPDSGYVLGGTGNGMKIIRSVDYGENWSTIAQLDALGGNVNCLEYLGNNIVIAGTGWVNTEIFRSIDNGNTWSLVGAGSGGNVYCLAYLGDGIMLAGTDNNPAEILRSTDYGATWVQIATLPPMVSCMALANLGDGIAVAGVANPNGNIWRTTDYGVTWTDLGRQYDANSINALIKLDDGRGMAGTGPAGTYCKVLRSLAPGANGDDGGEVAFSTAKNKKPIILTHWRWKNKLGEFVDAYYAPIDTRCGDVFYDGRILSCSPVTRAIDDRTGLYSVSDMNIELANHDMEMSHMLARYFLKNQLVEIFHAWCDEPETWKRSVFQGIVVDHSFKGTSFFVTIRDVTQKYFKVKVPPEVCT